MPSTELGAALRRRFLLQEGAIFLNHGSFGAAPDMVRAAQDGWRRTIEAQPDVFFRETAWSALREAADTIGRFCGGAGEDLVFTGNVTEAVAVILDAMQFQAGDEVVVLDVAYAAVKRALDVTARRTGLVVRQVRTGLEMTPEAYAASLTAAITGRTRLVLLDHIVSPTAQRIPIEALIPIARQAGARVFIDGAHALGQITPLGVASLGADWYASNAHKWLFAPRGSCILHSAPGVQAITRPVVVSHYYDDPYPRRFDYVGTRDVTAHLAAPACIAFIEACGVDAIDAHRAGLKEAADEALARLGARLVTPAAPAIAAWALPQSRPAVADDGPDLMRAMWTRHRIQIAANVTHGRLLIRLSLQIYNDTADLEGLARALAEDGWPGR